MSANSCLDTFQNEEGEEYESSRFGGFPEYFRRKKIKLQNLDVQLREQSAQNPQIFRGVVAHINGYTQPSLNDLHKLIVSYGGGFIQYLDGKTQVTHIIASSLTPKKTEEFKKYRIVKPAWIVDSVNAGRLLPWDAYRIVDEGVGQKVLHFDHGRIVSQKNHHIRGYRDQSDASWYNGQFQSQTQEDPSNIEDRDPMDEDTAENIDEDAEENMGEDAEDDTDEDMDGDMDENMDENMEAPEQPAKETAHRHSDHTHVSSPFEERTLFLDGAWSPQPIKADSHQTPDHSDSSLLQSTFRGEDDTLEKVASSTSKSDKGIDHVLEDVVEHVLDQDDTLKYYMRPVSPKGRDRTSPRSNTSDGLGSILPSKRAKMTAEEHNAILLADPRIRKSTVVNPDFLEQYYRESRLHHLSTWKANLKSQIQKMTAEKTLPQKTRTKRSSSSRKYILHVDFDSFFVAVSLKKCPQFKDSPAVVAHGGGSGSEIASCNYPARKFGVKNGMWMKRAQDLYSDLKVLPYDFPAYEEASRIFYDAIIRTGGIVQSVSIDEALVDVSAECISAGGSDGKQPREGSTYREQIKADEIAQCLRDQVLSNAGCAVSVGIGGNILLAKVALRKAKPAGQYQIKPEEVLDFIGQLTVQDLPGVAYSIGGKLEDIGVRYVKDIRELTKEKLITALGPKTGEKIWDYSRGIDKTEVGDQVIRKSVSAEVNWGVRFETQEQADEFVESLCGELHKRLITECVKGRQFTMKIMRRAPDAPLDPPKHLGHGKCDSFSKSVALGTATNATQVLAKEALSILHSYGFSPGELRGIGVQMTRLEPLKATLEGTLESSQRRLQFKTKDTTASAASDHTNEPIHDDIRTPQKPKQKAYDDRYNVPNGLEASESPSRKPLNVAGTQFIMPTAVDPEVLAELPVDIRSKLTKAAIPGEQSAGNAVASKRFETVADLLPTESQLDKEALDALPATVRAEIAAFYDDRNRASRDRSLLLSPTGPRPQSLVKKAVSRKRGGGIATRGRRASKFGSSSTLTQAAFVTSRPRSDSTISPEPISEDFLAALPEDIRREVLDDARRERLKRTSGIDIGTGTRAPRPVSRDQQDDIAAQAAAELAAPVVDPVALVRERTITLPPRPATPTFTMKKFSHLPELREAVSAWVNEFRTEGPYEEDVEALNKYLRAVVVDEGDMNKAVSVVKWFDWVLAEMDETEQAVVAGKWKEALKTVKETVQTAVDARGLGELQF